IEVALALQDLERPRPAVGAFYVMPAGFQEFCQAAADILFVIDDKQLRHQACSGSAATLPQFATKTPQAQTTANRMPHRPSKEILKFSSKQQAQRSDCMAGAGFTLHRHAHAGGAPKCLRSSRFTSSTFTMFSPT